MSQKAQLRAEYKRRRAAIPAGEHERLGALVHERLLDDPALKKAATVYSYLAFGREVPTAAVLRDLLESGKRVLIPPADRHADPLVHAELLQPSMQAAAESPVTAVALDVPFHPGQVDVFLVPGIVWDLRGYRVGFGGGFFDRLLAAGRQDAVKIGLAFEEQILPVLPEDPWDIPVDRLVTEARTVSACR